MCVSVQNLITKSVWLKVKGMVEKYAPTKPIYNYDLRTTTSIMKKMLTPMITTAMIHTITLHTLSRQWKQKWTTGLTCPNWRAKITHIEFLNCPITSLFEVACKRGRRDSGS